MATNLALDDEKIEELKKVGGFKTKREAVNAAVEESLLKRKQQAFKRLFGTVEFDPDYDHKIGRRKVRK